MNKTVTTQNHSSIQIKPINYNYIKQEPYINDTGIWIPTEEYILEDCAASYTCLITKELFVEAYNKWIKNN